MMFRRRRVLQGMLGAGALAFAGRDVAGQSRGLGAAAGAGAETDGQGLLHGLPRQALVIGNSRYKDAPLRNPANDANAIAEQLKRLGFQVVQALDAGRAVMLEAIRAFGSQLARQRAVGLFYFAGHGVQLAWRNYLIPVDAMVDNPEDVRERAVELNTLLQGLTRAKNPMNVIILDACRDNPFGTRVRPDQRGLSQFDAPPGSLLAYATAPGNVASDGDGEHGLYTENLLREIQVPEAKIEDVFKRVRLHVRRRTKGQQIPWESTSLEEDFYFVQPKAAARIGQETVYGHRRDFMLRAGHLAQTEVEPLRTLQLAQAARPDSAQLERQYEEQLAIWEKVRHAQDPEPLETFLLRYPSGWFSELAEFRLDQVLARQGEKKIVIQSSPDNPFSKGTSVANTNHKVGDSYTYRVTDLLTRRETGRYTQTVTRVTETEVTYDNGVVTDLLGNTLRDRGGMQTTGVQFWGLDYSIGKRWKSRSSIITAAGQAMNVDLDLRVVNRERITVPAGTFYAFVVEITGWSTGAGRSAQTLGKRWIAPEQVRRSILIERTRVNVGSGGPRYSVSEREELVSYRAS